MWVHVHIFLYSCACVLYVHVTRPVNWIQYHKSVCQIRKEAWKWSFVPSPRQHLFLCPNGEKTWCWSRIHLLSFSNMCKSWLFKGFSVRPNWTWSCRWYFLWPAGEAPSARWNPGDFGRNNVCGRGVMTKTSKKGLIPEVSPVTAWHRNMCVVFSGRAERRVSSFCSTWTPSAQLREESFRGPTSLRLLLSLPWCQWKIFDFTECSWQTPKKAAEVQQGDMYDNLSSRFDEGCFGSYHCAVYQILTSDASLAFVKVWS